jgi:cell division protein FtsN
MAKKSLSKAKSSQRMITMVIVIAVVLILIYLAYMNQPHAQVLWTD